MKYLLFLFFLVGFISCNLDNNTVTIPKDDYEKLIGGTNKPYKPQLIRIQNYLGEFQDFYIVKSSDGHEFITNDVRSQYMDNKILTHSPSCELCKQKYDSLLKHG